jgi:hypothetical protein
MVFEMRYSLKRKEDLTVKSWINDKPISTSDWEVFSAEEGESEIVILVKDPKTNNQLRINITKHENFEEVITE